MAYIETQLTGINITKAITGLYLRIWNVLPKIVQYKILQIPAEYYPSKNSKRPAFIINNKIIGDHGFALHSISPTYSATLLYYDKFGRTIKREIQ